MRPARLSCDSRPQTLKQEVSFAGSKFVQCAKLGAFPCKRRVCRFAPPYSRPDWRMRCSFFVTGMQRLKAPSVLGNLVSDAGIINLLCKRCCRHRSVLRNPICRRAVCVRILLIRYVRSGHGFCAFITAVPVASAGILRELTRYQLVGIKLI
jgi:hypothetical protein